MLLMLLKDGIRFEVFLNGTNRKAGRRSRRLKKRPGGNRRRAMRSSD
jgi:hypothetical protein